MINSMDADVIVIGAGAAGLMAAYELALTARKVIVVEALEKTGGRIQSLHVPGLNMPVELGPEFVHGQLELTQWLIKKAGAQTVKAEGSVWRKGPNGLEEQTDFIEDFDAVRKKLNEPDQDIPVAEFLTRHLGESRYKDARLSLKSYVEGYYAADPGKASTFALRKELSGPDETQYRIRNGYMALVNCLETACREMGVVVQLNEEARTINWSEGMAAVQTSNHIYKAEKLLVTVSLGVLKAGTINFIPALPDHAAAAQHLGFGGVIKTILHFKEAFWKQESFTRGKDLSDAGFIFSDALIPTWWTLHPVDAPVLTGWAAGPHADQLKELTNEDILTRALDSLALIFQLEPSYLRKQLESSYIANWLQQPHFLGGYSYDVVNGNSAKKVLQQPAADTVYFSGEALYEGVEIGTVEAALRQGRETAHQMIAAFKS